MAEVFDRDEMNGSEVVQPQNAEPVPDPVQENSSPAPSNSGTTYSWVNPKISGQPDQTDNSASYTGQRISPAYEKEPNTYQYRRTSYQTSQEQNQQGPAMNRTNAENSSAGTYYHYQSLADSSDEPVKNKKKSTKKTRKSMSTGKKWGMTLAMAAVFGLVAGSVFTGTAYVGQKLVGSNQQKQEIEIPNTVTTPPESAAVSQPLIQENIDGSGVMTVRQVAETCMPSLVAISTITVQEVRTFFGTQSQETPASGTGVIVGKNDSELLIATNNHVVQGAKSLSVVFANEQAIEGQIKGTDATNDLAVVAVKLDDIPNETLEQVKIATMGSSDDLAVGEQVVAIGNALGIGQSVTSGYVSALNRDISSTDESTGQKNTSSGLIQTDAAINPGNSGGALLNMRGELVGINEAKYSSTAVEGMGFAIPISKAEPILENLMSLETRYKVSEAQAAYIGITMADVNASVSAAYGMPVGVCIMSVMENSPAEAAGLKKGDIITSFDGRALTTTTELKEHLQYYASGETITIIVQRANEGEYIETSLALTLGSAADMPTDDGNSQSQQENNGGSGFFGNR